MNNFIMMPCVHPMDLMTEISFTCSYRLPVIDDDSEKKQMNIVIAMMTLKISVRMSRILRWPRSLMWITPIPI